MAFDAHSNFGYGSVATAPSPASSGTSLTLSSGQGALMPAAPFNATVWPMSVQPLTTNAEIVRVTNVSGDTLTITRAQESTSAQAIAIGFQFANTSTVKVFTDIETVASAAQTTANAAVPKTTTVNGHALSANVVVSASDITTGTLPSGQIGALGTPSSGNLSSCTADGTNAVGFLGIPQNSQSSGSYTVTATDNGKQIYIPSGTETVTLPANASVALGIGFTVTFINLSSSSATIAITSDTLYLAGAGTTGSRTLAQYGVATATKLTATTWIINGTGLT